MIRKTRGGILRIILGLAVGRAVSRSRLTSRLIKRSSTAARALLLVRLVRRLRGGSKAKFVQVRTESAVISVEPT